MTQLGLQERSDLRTFWRFVAPHRRRLWLAAATMLLTVAVQLPLPFLTMVIVDRLVKARDLSLFSIVVVGLFAILAFNAIVTMAHTLVVVMLREHVLGSFHLEILERLQRASLIALENHPPGFLASRVRADLVRLNAILAGPLLGILQSAILLVGGALSLTLLSWKLALVCLATLPAFALTIIVFNRRIRACAQLAQDARAQVGWGLQEVLARVPVVKAFGAEWDGRLRQRSQLLHMVNTVVREEMTSAAARRSTYLVSTVAPFVVLWFGAAECLAGRMSVGQLVAFQAFISYVFSPLQAVLSQNVDVQSALVSLRRLVELRNLPGERRTGVGPVPHRFDLCAESIVFRYPSGPPVLDRLSFHVDQGERLAIVGASGCGKSTVLRLLLRFYDPESGRILLGGIDVRQLDIAQYRSHLAVVFEDPYLLSGTVEENLRLARRSASSQQIEEAVSLACASEFIRALPRGLDTRIGEGGIALSNGQRLRLGIARAMLKDAPIVLLDEPTKGLDEQTATAVLAHLDSYLRGRTAIVISHDPAVVAIADRVCDLRVPFVEADVDESFRPSAPAIHSQLFAAAHARLGEGNRPLHPGRSFGCPTTPRGPRPAAHHLGDWRSR
ncbi:MAG TPA: ABC transporter ATP-binding protein [Vicinamibacterales bacterium]